MTPEQYKFAERLVAEAKTHDQWLCIMRFGLKTLLDEPAFLLSLIWDEGDRRSGNAKCDADLLHEYLEELGLKIVPTI